MAELRSWQVPVVDRLRAALIRHGAALDASGTGAGKSFCACALVAERNEPTLVVCPRAVRPMWHRVAAEFGTELDTINYEMVTTGRTPYGSWAVPKGCRKPRFQWHPGIKFLIFDEAHRCAGIDTKNAGLVHAAREQRIPTLALTATPGQDPLRWKALGHLLGLHDNDESPDTLRNLNRNVVPFWTWCRRHGCRPGQFRALEFGGTEEERLENMAKIHRAIFPAKGVRVRTEDLGDAFPQHFIEAELLDLGDPTKIDKLYAGMGSQLEALEDSRQADRDKVLESIDPEVAAGLSNAEIDTLVSPVVKILRARQEVELLKVPALVDLAQDRLAEGFSVAFFMNFSASLHALRSKLERVLGPVPYVDGSQVGLKGDRHREACIQQFQSNHARVIACNIEAGGVGIGLHDLHGGHPRWAYILPGWRAEALRQSAGRIPRVGARTPCQTRFLFADGTVERRVWTACRNKLSNLDRLLDSDLSPFAADTAVLRTL